MKLLRFGLPGQERPGMLGPEGEIRDLGDHLPDLADEALDPARLAVLATLDPTALPRVAGCPRLGPPVGGRGKIVCVGLNYADHAREANMAIPSEPVLFMKGCRLTGPTDPIPVPPGAAKVDWEVELAVVMGRVASHVGEAAALACVAGLAAFIDMSERAYQLEQGGQWVKGKSYPGFAPLGPWLVTLDEVADVQRLPLWLEVNGQRYQHSNTEQMIFSVAALVAYISRFMTLYPGDVIATGTPPGVGMGLKPEPVFLKAGDMVRCAIEGLGEQHHTLEAASGGGG